ncbi:hypothetical protein NC652_025739 [Populus alba x Populus x berolinensis]|nr:hypothetical protein NC652_025739 [Populus alba x Populus x berolinensis]
MMGSEGRIFRLSHSRWVTMDITGTDPAASFLFTFQSLILAELGLKLSVKSASVLCIFHILLVRKSKTSPVTSCKTIRATADCMDCGPSESRYPSLEATSTSFSWFSASPLPWLRNGNRWTRSSRNCSPELPRIYKQSAA